MAVVKQGFSASVNVTLFNSSDGTPLTGVEQKDVPTIYYVKDGDATPTAKSVAATDFREVDATNMPGVYQFDFTASELDTVGNFTVTIPAEPAINLEQKNFELEVVESGNITSAGKGVVHAWKGKRVDITVPIYAKNDPVTKPDPASFRPGVPWYATKVTMSRPDGTQVVLDETMFGTGIDYSQENGNWGNFYWREVDTTNSPGLYTLTTNIGTSSTGLTDQVGDYTVNIEPSGLPVWDVYNQSAPRKLEQYGDVVFVSETEGYAVSNDDDPNVYQTTDGGMTWSVFHTADDFLYAIDAIDNGGTTEIYVGGEANTNKNNDPEIWYYDGTTWNDLNATLGADIGPNLDIQGISIVTASEIWFACEENISGYEIGSYTGGTGGTYTQHVFTTGTPEATDIAAYDVGGTTYASVTLNDGSIQFTNDGGSTFSDVGPATTDPFFSVQFPSFTTGYAHTSTEIYKSTDSGASWSLLTDQIPCVYLYVHNNLVLMASAYSDEDVSISTDGGSSWDQERVYGRTQTDTATFGGDVLNVWTPDGSTFYASDTDAVLKRRGTEIFNPVSLHLRVQEDYIGSQWDGDKDTLQDIRKVADAIYTKDSIEVQLGETVNVSLDFVRDKSLAPVQNIPAVHVKATAIKNGSIQSANPVSNLLEISGVDFPGKYELEINGSEFDELGDYFLVVEPAPPWQFREWNDPAINGYFSNGASVFDEAMFQSNARFAGQNGLILAWDGFNEEFTVATTPTSENLNDIDGVTGFSFESSTSDYFEFAVGDNGTIIFKDYNGAATWIDVSDAETANYTGLAAFREGATPDYIALVVSPTLADIRRYNHTTTTWSAITDPSGGSATWRDIEENEGVIIVGGDNSEVYRSDDGGSSWSDISADVGMGSQDTENILYVEGDWWITTDSSALFRSEDDGLTWESVNVDNQTVHYLTRDQGNDYRAFNEGTFPIYISDSQGDVWEREPSTEVGFPRIYAAYDEVAVGDIEDGGNPGYFRWLDSSDFKSFTLRIRVTQPPTKPPKTFQ